MKTWILVTLSLFFATGCSQKVDPKTAALEERITKIEVDQAAHISNGMITVSNQWEVMNGDRTNLLEALRFIRNHAASNNAEMAALHEGLTVCLMDLSNRTMMSISKSVNPARTPPVQATRDGIPIAVYNQIAAEISARYPTDYSMQEILIRGQIDAYKKLHPY